MEQDFLMQIRTECESAARELMETARLKEGDRVIVGCSSSEVMGGVIGKNSVPEVGEVIFHALNGVFAENGIHLAAQCCEHLNRAIVIDRRALHGEEIVNAIPQPKAGGSFAAAAYKGFTDPVVIAEIRTDAGLDIGGTMIGMHLKRVAVPLRLTVRKIGEAHLAAARVRPPFVGGERAVYDPALL
ncbi:MAG: TIGR01440 family protein [Clostridia bacterium]|nr:TIGR01440 family protein [Clostridia bacterium]